MNEFIAMTPIAYRARWIFPVDTPPIAGGVVELDSTGRIAAISEKPDREAIDLGDVAIVPSLVNAHVHLEFSDLAEPVKPARPFSAWIKNVLAARRERTAPITATLRRGLQELRSSGTSAAGEIATHGGDCYDELSEGVPLCLFREVIGPTSSQWPALLDGADVHLKDSANHPARNTGLSPHAPYTVPQALFERLISIARRHRAPVAVHLAETASERTLLSEGRGELVDMMREADLWDESLHPTNRTFSDWIDPLASASSGLVIHGNYLNNAELDTIAACSNLTLVYCPRTHASFQHPPHPFRRLLDQGGRVALGTDGRSSNPDLDLWAEAAFVARRNPDLASDIILDMATRAGAEALGLSDRAGLLAAGRAANFLVVDVEEFGGRPVLFRSGRDPRRVFHRGVEISRKHTPCQS